MGAWKGSRDANFPGGVCRHCTGRFRDPGQVEGPGGRQQQVRAAGSPGLASLAGSRGGNGRGPKPGNATTLALLRRPHALVIQHPDFPTGGRGRPSNRAFPPRGASEHPRPALATALGGAPGRAWGPVSRRREPAPPDARGGQADGGRSGPTGDAG